MVGNFVVIDPIRFATFLREPQGPNIRNLIIRAENVKQEAIRIAPVGKPDPLGRSTHDPRNLRDHIVKRITEDATGPIAFVGVENVPYAIWVHEGAQPHPIYPRNASRLVFYSERAGRVIFMPPGAPVHHPGNKPNRFLLRALAAAG